MVAVLQNTGFVMGTQTARMDRMKKIVLLTFQPQAAVRRSSSAPTAAASWISITAMVTMTAETGLMNLIAHPISHVVLGNLCAIAACV